MGRFLRYFLTIIVGLGGVALIMTSFFGAFIGGAAGFWIQIVIGIALIAAALAIRPR